MIYKTCACALLVLAPTESSLAADWFVSPKGDDDAVGSREAPWQTLRRAVRKDSGVGPGDTVNLLEGVYRKWTKVEVGGRGSSWDDARLLTIRPAPGHEGRVFFKGVRPVDMPWKRWKGDIFFVKGVDWPRCRYVLQGLTPEAVPPNEPPPETGDVKLGPDEALLYVPLYKDQASYWMKRKDYLPETLAPGEALVDDDGVYVHFRGINGRPADPSHYVIQTPFFGPITFGPNVSFVRITGIRFTLHGWSIMPITQNIGVHHIQIDDCEFSWNQHRSIDLQETGEHGSLFLRVVNNRFHHMNEEAIQLGADHCLIRGNEFYHSMDPRWRIRRDSGIAVRVIGNFNVVDYNYIHDYFPTNGEAVTAIDLEAGNPMPMNPSHTLVRYNVIENPRPDIQAMRAISLSIQYDCIRNRFHHNLIVNPTLGIRLIAPKRENYFLHTTLLNAKEEGIFFFGLDEPLGEYHDSQQFNTARSPERNVFQNNVVVQSNGQDFEHLFRLKKNYQRKDELSSNVFLANHWSSDEAGAGREPTAGDPRLGPGYSPAKDSALVDSGAPLTRTTSAGTGTSVAVTESRSFSDGNDIAEGDLARVGDNQPQPVIRVDVETHTLHFERPLKWHKDDPVSYPWAGAGPDRGALERGLPWPHLERLPESCPLGRQ